MLVEELYEDMNSYKAFVAMNKKIEQQSRIGNNAEMWKQWQGAVEAVKSKLPGGHIDDSVPDDVISRLLVAGEGLLRRT